MNVDIKDLEGKVRVNVYNLQGILLDQSETDDGHLVVDLSAYPPGLYLFEVDHKGLNVAEKIIKRI